MGGAVGLKGTDGRKTLREAMGRGAKSVSPERGLRFLEEVQRQDKRIEFLIAPGSMGANVASQLKLQHESIGRSGRTTTSEDSARIARLKKRKRADVIGFCGGGGEARDRFAGRGWGPSPPSVPARVECSSCVFVLHTFRPAAATVPVLSRA